MTEDEQRVLEKEARINVIVARGGQGIRVWGSRTLSSDSSHAEIAATRSVAALGSFIRELTSWAAFERSDVRTWNRLQSLVEVALDTLWRKGAFAGETAADAYYVHADAEVNPRTGPTAFGGDQMPLGRTIADMALLDRPAAAQPA